MKVKVLIILIILVIIVGISSVIFFYKRKEIKDIKSRYSKYVEVINNTNIYDGHRNKVGRIYKGSKIELSSIKGKYYKIKDSSYYINYRDIKKINNIDNDKINNNYLYLNKVISTNKKTTLYHNNKKFISLNSINSKVLYINNNRYYIYYMGKILSIDKTNNIKETTTNTDKGIDSIIVLKYGSISDVCNSDTCTNRMTYEEEASIIKGMGFYILNDSEYNMFINNNLNIKNKSIYIDKNNKSKENSKVKIYNIMNYTSIDNFINILEGKELIEDKKDIEVSVPVLNYHFFYDPKLGEECSEGICLTTDKFREELDYLRDNHYKVLTMDEFVKWMYKEIDVPIKSVLITIDDGAMGTGKHNGNKLIPILEEYHIPATLFLIAGWWDIENYRSKYLTIQSHTYDMHKYGDCKRGQLVCANYDEAKADLQKSIDIIGSNETFCYPFYSHDDEAIRAIKDLGFKLAFVGGMRNARRSSNKYLVPRYPIHSDITMNEFINMVK